MAEEKVFTRIAPDDPALRYLGHWAVSAESAHGYFQGGVEFLFTGDCVGVEAALAPGADSCCLTVCLDGGEPFVVPYRTAGNLLLAAGLDGSEHRISIHSDFQEKQPVFTAYLLAENGRVLPRVDRPSIEFAGDSITVGYVRDGIGSTSLTFACRTALALNAAFDIVAFGGLTLTERPTATDCTGLVNRFFRLGPICAGAAAEEPWDLRRCIPDNLVIGIGSNDWDDSWDKTGYFDRFQSDYAAFLRHVREVYTDTEIFVLTPYNSYCTAVGDKIRAAAREAGDVHLVEGHTGLLPSHLHPVDRIHINEEAHRIVAKNLCEAIRRHGKL